uniref:Uncharacterized protein n=1 Tax=Mycolicibacterium neoaurum VKM Ac-1815D TaxID=700508 RepID=V5XIF1_MYCNE
MRSEHSSADSSINRCADAGYSDLVALKPAVESADSASVAVGA